METKEYLQLSIEDLAKNQLALTQRNKELEIAYARLDATNNELKRAENQLRQQLERNEAYFKGAFDNSAIGMALVDVAGNWKEVNESFCKMVGYTREELMKLTFQDITHPEDLQIDLRFLHEVIAGKRKSYQMEKRYFHKNGDAIWVLLAVSAIRDETGNIVHFISQIEDITDRKKIEAALQSSKEKYKLLFYSTPLPIWIYDVATFQILDVNEPAIDHYGYSRHEFLHMTLPDIIREKDVPGLTDISRKAAHSKGVIRFGTTGHIKKGGHPIKVEISGHSIRFNDRDCMMMVCNDITEKHAVEKALQRSNERYEYVTKATFDAIWDWDLKKDDVYWGEGYQTLFGYDVNIMAAEKNSWSKLVHPEDFPQVIDGILKLIEGTEDIWSAEYRYLKADGEYAFVIDKGLVIRNEKRRRRAHDRCHAGYYPAKKRRTTTETV